MFRLGTWLLAGLAAFTLAAHEAKAVGFQPVSPEELKMTSEPQAPGAPAIILFRQVERDDNPRTGHEDNYFRIKILTEEGRKYAGVRIPFFRDHEDVVNIKARTIRPDGSIVGFNGNVLEKQIVKANGVKYFAKTFTLPEVEVGGIIEYFYSLTFGEHYIYSSTWILSQELFTRKAVFSLKPFYGTNAEKTYGHRPSGFMNQVAAGGGLTVHDTWQSLPPGTAPPKEGTDRLFRMEANNVAAFHMEDFMPPPNELKARVDFTYEEGYGVFDDASFWKNYGKLRNGQMESFIGKRSAMDQALTQIVSPADPQEAKLRKIYDRVQQFRNTTYELGTTGQEAKSEQPAENLEEVWSPEYGTAEPPTDNVEKVWTRGYGTREQLTWLFLGLARAAGFEAYGCWVSSRDEYFFSPEKRQRRKLDANVVLVKLNGKDLYFEPGRAFTPFGVLAWPETAVRGLRLNKDGGEWIQTPLPPASDSRIESLGKLRLSPTGELEGRLTVTYTGMEAVGRRTELRLTGETEREKFLEDGVKSQIAIGSQVELVNQPDWASSETPLIAEFNLKIPNWASNAGQTVVTPAAIFTAGERGVFEPAKREHPIYFDYLSEKSEDVTIDLPPGWQVGSVPKAQDQDLKLVAYSLKDEQNQGTLHLKRRLTIGVGSLEQKYYAPLRAFFQLVRAGDGEQVVLQPGKIHASD
jgi:hypothetical protein